MRAETLEASGIILAEAEGKPVPRQLDGIQILRGVAASMVVFHHYCLAFLVYHGRSAIASYRSFAHVGAAGVDIFFCISGFVIIYSLLARERPVSWGAFVIARIKRIIPLYWLFSLAILAMWATGKALTSMVVTPGLVVRSLLLLPVTKSWADGRVDTHPILDQGWTLQYEALFYAACALVIAALGSRRVFPWAPLAVALFAAIAYLVPGAPAYLYDPLMLEFAGGTVLGWLAASGRLARLPAPRLWAWGAIVAGAGGLLLTTFLAEPEPWRVLVWGVPGFLIVLGCILLEPRRGGRIIDTAIFLGAASYSIYLGHIIVVLFVSAAMKYGHLVGAGDVVLLAATALTIAATSLVYPLVERPITKWIR